MTNDNKRKASEPAHLPGVGSEQHENNPTEDAIVADGVAPSSLAYNCMYMPMPVAMFTAGQENQYINFNPADFMAAAATVDEQTLAQFGCFMPTLTVNGTAPIMNVSDQQPSGKCYVIQVTTKTDVDEFDECAYVECDYEAAGNASEDDIRRRAKKGDYRGTWKNKDGDLLIHTSMERANKVAAEVLDQLKSRKASVICKQGKSALVEDTKSEKTLDDGRVKLECCLQFRYDPDGNAQDGGHDVCTTITVTVVKAVIDA